MKYNKNEVEIEAKRLRKAYDVETNGWRSFKTESFIEFLNVMKHQPNIEVTIY